MAEARVPSGEQAIRDRLACWQQSDEDSYGVNGSPQHDIADLLAALQQARQEQFSRCSEHPGLPLELVCVECFESERTADANARAEQVEAQLAAQDAAIQQLRVEIEQAMPPNTRARYLELLDELASVRAARPKET